MSKSGQARVPNQSEIDHLFSVIKNHRYPEKNRAIMQISFKLGLRVQEIALLELKEVCNLDKKKINRGFDLYNVMSLPAIYTKGANATGKSTKKYSRKSIRFTTEEFSKLVHQIENMAKAGQKIDPETFYPEIKKHHGKSRDLPLVDQELRESLSDYIKIRIDQDPSVTPRSPLFLNQKGNPYSPNTLQEHMSLMLRDWAGIEKASSHSGRRSLITDVIHNQKKSIKVAQKIAGHVNASTTLIYDEPPEEEISDALNSAFKKKTRI